MSQVNINDPRGSEDRFDGDATAAAGINFMTVIIVGAIVIIALLALYWLFTSSGIVGPAVPAAPAAPVSPAKPIPTNPVPLPTVPPKAGAIVPFIASYFM